MVPGGAYKKGQGSAKRSARVRLKVETAKFVVKATLALGILSLLLDFLYWINTPVYAQCSTIQGVTTCQYDYLKNTGERIFIPLIVGGILVAAGSFTFFTMPGRRRMMNQTSSSSIPPENNVFFGRTLSLVYLSVPAATILGLFALALMHTWSGLPIPYTYECVLLFNPYRSSCLSIDWFGLWLDSIFYTAIGYCSAFVILKWKTSISLPP